MKTKFKKIQYVYTLCHTRAKQGHLSTFRQILEIAYLQIVHGFGYSLYHFAGMWDKDASWDYKTSFLSQKKYAHKVHELNERKYHGVTQYKPFEKAFFKLFGIPTGTYIGTLNTVWGRTANGQNLRTCEDLHNLLDHYVGSIVCFKLFEGAGGLGFKAFDIIKEENKIQACLLPNREKFDLESLLNKLLDENQTGWVLEEYIEQHATISAINPSSVNTIRLYVFQDKQGHVRVLGGFLRIGRQGSMIDNTSAGGMRCRIDIETGILGKVTEKDPMMRATSQHPDHGSQVEGVSIPFWNEAMELGIKTLTVLPKTRFAGFDVAITPEGPVMVEVNIQPDVDGLCFLKIPAAKVFNS